ncbi:unnamed protein product [Amoebophrya sp. A25]|nr:unnamed protein product [Amoebophrya sp. A25]|eukprot:GSA25T00019290001.1
MKRNGRKRCCYWREKTFGKTRNQQYSCRLDVVGLLEVMVMIIKHLQLLSIVVVLLVVVDLVCIQFHHLPPATEEKLQQAELEQQELLHHPIGGLRQ